MPSWAALLAMVISLPLLDVNIGASEREGTYPLKNEILTLNEKSIIIKTVIECVKESNIFIGLKKTCLGVLE